MPDFDHARFGPVITELLQDRKLSPLDRGRPDPTFGPKLQALDAERLVAQAHQAQIAGDSSRAFSLLREAVRLAPDYELARWRLGIST